MPAASNVDKKMFENDDSKFWEVWCDNVTVFTRFGKVGSQGQTRLKKEANTDAAQKLLEKMVRDKAGEGYVQKGGKAVVDSSIKPLDAKALKKHLSSLGADEASHLVFADWLQSHDHPWGEMITLQHGIKTATTDKKREQLEKAAAKLLKERGTAIIGPAAQNKASSFTWNLALLKRAAIGTAVDTKEMLKDVKTFLAMPIASKLEGIAISPLPTTFKTVRDFDDSTRNIVDPWSDLDAIAKLLPDSITHVGFGGWPATAAMAYVKMPNFGKISKAFPKLKSLELTGCDPDKPGKLALSQLTDLSVRFASASGEHLATISSSKMPKLERLNVWLGGMASCILDDIMEAAEWDEDDEDADRYPPTFKGTELEELDVYDVSNYITADHIDAFLTSLSPSVKHLALQGSSLKLETFDAIINHKSIKQLKTLDLRGHGVNDEKLKSLTKAKKNLAHLEQLHITETKETSAAIKKLIAILPNAKVAKPPEDTDGFIMRYTAVME